jgi:hypothetical protein
MSDRLDTELRALSAALVDESPSPPAFDELRSVPIERTSRSRGIRPLVAAACVVAIAVAAIALSKTLDGTNDDHSTASKGDREARLVHVGDTANLGPMIIRVKQAVSTVTPHTYVLTMSIRNRGSRAVPLPSVLLSCKAPLVPGGFGITGFVISDRDLAAHETRAGDVTLYPQQVCENPRVTFSRHVVKGPQDRITYSLRGLI